jgi:hypothetical protein
LLEPIVVEALDCHLRSCITLRYSPANRTALAEAQDPSRQITGAAERPLLRGTFTVPA